ncbi:hypothetical protein [Streptomyces sp. NPDC005148]
MRVIVAGGAGAMGRRLVLQLVALGHQACYTASWQGCKEELA